jgi:hypothetical protein
MMWRTAWKGWDSGLGWSLIDGLGGEPDEFVCGVGAVGAALGALNFDGDLTCNRLDFELVSGPTRTVNFDEHRMRTMARH